MTGSLMRVYHKWSWRSFSQR